MLKIYKKLDVKQKNNCTSTYNMADESDEKM